MLFMFNFVSVITDIQPNDFKTVSKVLYKGNHERVRNQLRLLLPIKSAGRGTPRRCPRASEGKLTAGAPPRPAPPPPARPGYLFILSLSFKPFFPSNRICCTLATLPTLAALWTFPRSLCRMWYSGRELTRLPLSLRGLVEEPKSDSPFLLPKPKIFFIAEPTRFRHTSPPPRLLTVS